MQIILLLVKRYQECISLFPCIFFFLFVHFMISLWTSHSHFFAFLRFPLFPAQHISSLVRSWFLSDTRPQSLSISVSLSSLRLSALPLTTVLHFQLPMSHAPAVSHFPCPLPPCAPPAPLLPQHWCWFMNCFLHSDTGYPAPLHFSWPLHHCPQHQHQLALSPSWLVIWVIDFCSSLLLLE